VWREPLKATQETKSPLKYDSKDKK